MAPTFSRPKELTEEAGRIFFVVDSFLRSTSTHKPNPALERFPPSLESTPWRRIYMAVGAHSTAYLTMEPWDPRELSAGSARGLLWFFTELPRIGERICRKTVDGRQTWSAKTGREHKNGFPFQIRVARLLIKGTAYHMLELTLDKERPTVSLCKIWRMGTATAESPQIMNQGTSTSNKVDDDSLEEATEMQIDQPQGQFEGSIEQQLCMPNHEMSLRDTAHPPECWNINHATVQLRGKEQVPGHALSTSDFVVHPYSTGEYLKYNLIGQHEGTEQQLHIPHHVLSASNYACHPNSTCGYFNDNLLTEQFGGQFEGKEQEPQMHDQAMSSVMSDYTVAQNSMWGQLDGVEEQVKMREDVLSMSGYIVLPKLNEDFIPSTGQDDNSVYQGAVSYLFEEKESFKHIVLHGGNEAQEIASKAQSLASTVRNLLNRFTSLGINTTNNNQLRTTTNSVTEQTTIHAPETTARDEFPEQERQQQMEGCSIEEDYFYLEDFYQSSGTNFDDQGKK